LVDELSSKIKRIENEMDDRVKFLVSSINDFHDECKKKLDLTKEVLKR
jgi:hypothetical protein